MVLKERAVAWSAGVQQVAARVQSSTSASYGQSAKRLKTPGTAISRTAGAGRTLRALFEPTNERPPPFIASGERRALPSSHLLRLVRAIAILQNPLRAMCARPERRHGCRVTGRFCASVADCCSARYNHVQLLCR